MTNLRSGKRAYRKSLESFAEAAMLIYEELDTPKSLACFILLKEALRLRKDDIEQSKALMRDLLGVKFNPTTDYCRIITGGGDSKVLANRIYRDYQAVKLLSKQDIDVGIDKQGKALERFFEAEARCQIANQNLSFSGLQSASLDAKKARYIEFLFRCRKKVEQILGYPNLDRIVNGCGFGPGVTQEAKNRPILPAKISSSEVFSPGAWKLMSHIVGESPSWFEAITGIESSGACCLLPQVMSDYDYLTFVKKNWKTLRTICISHGLAVYVQKGIGNEIRSLLKRFGINLNDQSVNQAFAEKASLSNEIMTLDLESASDSNSTGLIRFLLPDNWLRLLESVRSTKTVLPNGEVLFLQKFSAMGNGYTFELESLVFYAIVATACDEHGLTTENVSVYGDDIICPSSLYPFLKEIFTFVGHKVNEEKTFVSGYFRESCGKDYVDGHNVRPFFLKKDLTPNESKFILYNQIRGVNSRTASYSGATIFRRVLGFLYHGVDKESRFLIPPSFPDDAGFKTDKVPKDGLPKQPGYCGRYVKYRTAITSKARSNSVAALCAKLMTFTGSEWWCPSQPELGNVFPRRGREIVRYKSSVTYVLSWS